MESGKTQLKAEAEADEVARRAEDNSEVARLEPLRAKSGRRRERHPMTQKPEFLLHG